jgi:two-component system OmpR family sensor kinase
MAWDIDSTRISNQKFGRLRTRLLLSYLFVIASILATFSAVVYALVAHDRNQQLNTHLRQIASASASTLEIIQHEYQELTTEGEYQEYKDSIPTEADGTVIPITLSQLMGKYKTHSDSDWVPSPLASADQGVEWFDAQQGLIVHEGDLFPATTLPDQVSPEGLLVQHRYIRSFILAVDLVSTSGESQRLGYVRANESTIPLKTELRQFRSGLVLGVAIVSGLVTFGGFWLTHESLQPILASFEQLKQFTSDASHELRNPLTAIRASIAVMQTHPERIHPADVEKLKAIASASAQMSQLVDDLLLLTRMDRQAFDQQAWRQIALDEMLEDLVDLYSDRAEVAQLSLKCQLLSPVEIYGDSAQLHRLFTNLLTNALQYTPTGGSVTVSLQRRETHALVRIEDTGIGIAPDQLPQIFNRFWRADPARSYHQNGSGLGLAIAQSIAQRHNGNITVKSQIASGSCFQVTFPLA